MGPSNEQSLSIHAVIENNQSTAVSADSVPAVYL